MAAFHAARAIGKQHSSHAGQLHVLVNNVGTNIRKPTVEYTEADFQALLSSNLSSAFHLTQLCHDMLKAAGAACVLFNSSVAGGPLAMKSGSIYAMTKGVSEDGCLCCGVSCVRSAATSSAARIMTPLYSQPCVHRLRVGCVTCVHAYRFLLQGRLLIVPDLEVSNCCNTAE
jgi:hypothetical protein